MCPSGGSVSVGVEGRRSRRRRGEFVIRRRDLDFLDHRRDVLHLVRDVHFGEFGRIPESVARYCRNRAGGDATRPAFSFAQGLQFCCGRSRLPLRVSNVTDPRALGLFAQTAPVGERAGVEHVAFDKCPTIPAPDRWRKSCRCFPSRRRCVPSGAAQNPVTCVGCDVQQPRVGMIGIQAINRRRDCRCPQSAALRVERQRVDQILRMAPDLARIAVGLNAINLGAAGDRGSCGASVGGGGEPRAPTVSVKPFRAGSGVGAGAGAGGGGAAAASACFPRPPRKSFRPAPPRPP